jgi:hypothetical protein
MGKTDRVADHPSADRVLVSLVAKYILHWSSCCTECHHSGLPARKASTGYLAIWVERSDRRPHRSEAADDKRYYKRAGESTYVMEHTDIEDAFNGIAPTELTLAFDGYASGGVYNDPQEGRIEELTLKFSLRNDDRRSACAPYVWVEGVMGGKIKRVITGAHQTSALNEYDFGARQTFSGDGNIFVHPGVAVPAFELTVRFSTRQFETLDGRRLREALIKFSYGYGCENSRMRTGTFEIGGTDIEDFRGTAISELKKKHQPTTIPPPSYRAGIAG